VRASVKVFLVPPPTHQGGTTKNKICNVWMLERVNLYGGASAIRDEARSQNCEKRLLVMSVRMEQLGSLRTDIIKFDI
jgi:hypothetical protein